MPGRKLGTWSEFPFLYRFKPWAFFSHCALRFASVGVGLALANVGLAPASVGLASVWRRLSVGVAVGLASTSLIPKRGRKFQPRSFFFRGGFRVDRKGLDLKFQSTIDCSKFSTSKAAIEFLLIFGPSGKLTKLMEIHADWQ